MPPMPRSVPMPFVAVALHVYVRAFVSDATVSGELSPIFDRDTPPLLEVQVTLK